MHLLFVLPEFPPDFGGGISSVYARLLPRLVEEHHCVTVLLASRDRLDQPCYHWQGVEVVPLQSSYLALAQEQQKHWRHHAFLYQFLPLAWAAWHQARALAAFDVVEVTDWAMLFLPWLVQQRRQPVVVSLHGSCGQVDWHGNPGARSGEGQLVRLLETAVLPLADVVIANSTLNADFWWQQCGVRSKVIPPIAVGQVTPGHRYSRSQHGAVVGRLQNWKGPEVLCKALRLVPSQQVDWIGEDIPWPQSSIMTSVHLRQLFPDVVGHQLHFLGKLPSDQVQTRISKAAFLCIPSLWDVFNVTVLEAISVGTPVLCSTQAGASMLLLHGQSGFLFDPMHPEELADALRRVQSLTSSDRQRLAVEAMNRAAERASASLVASQHQALYAMALADFRDRKESPWLSDSLLSGNVAVGSNTIVRRRRFLFAPIGRFFRWLVATIKR